ncbi:MAG: dihydrolipoyl dehydrogenase [candidate division WOR-3 bacterium]
MRIGIIGGGPSGYSFALKVADNNEVFLFEKEEVGGVCLNKGCIPTKSLISSVEIYEMVKSYQKKPNWRKIQESKDLAIKRGLLGIKSLLKEKKVKVIKKEARLKDDRKIEVDGETFSFDKVVLATGSKPIPPPFPIQGEFWDSTDALNAKELPESLAIIGAGFVGIELSYIFSSLGCKVQVIEKEAEILPGEDVEFTKILRKSLIRKGIEFHLSSEVLEVKKENEKFNVFFKEKGKNKDIIVEKVIVCIGRIPNIEGIPEEIVEKDRVKVNEFLETEIENVYAIGDCIGGYLLAHSAFKEAEILAENILGRKVRKDNYVIPKVLYTKPEFASVGFSEKETLKENYKISKLPFASNGRAIAEGKTSGYVKIIHSGNGEILGGVIIGERASELISILSLAIINKLGLKELSECVFPHPTFSEIIRDVSSIALADQ